MNFLNEPRKKKLGSHLRDEKDGAGLRRRRRRRSRGVSPVAHRHTHLQPHPQPYLMCGPPVTTPKIRYLVFHPSHSYHVFCFCPVAIPRSAKPLLVLGVSPFCGDQSPCGVMHGAPGINIDSLVRQDACKGEQRIVTALRGDGFGLASPITVIQLGLADRSISS